MGLRLAITALSAAAMAFAAAPASAATINAKAKAKIIKPLVLESLQDLDLGMIVLNPGTWSGATVKLSQNGLLTCPANVSCSGVPQVAIYTVSGSNGETAAIIAPDVTLVNQADMTKTLTLVVDSPATVTFTNSGVPGVDFQLGGSITLDSTTAEGDYVGTFNVSVEYQ
ncbi:MAG TPA: DUF4402 domain-containing protein [Sphingomicrobium sp.]|nr:DUF4402 domain-containing protein [Sphingomicrobium sp.]